MKILQINSVFRKGSTGNITAAIHDELLEMGEEAITIYGRGDRIKESGVYKLCGEKYAKMNNLYSRITGLMYGGGHISTNKIIKKIIQEKPDIVHLQCINGYFLNIYRLIAWLRDNKISTVLTLHAEFMYTANCGHALDCKRWQIGCGNCHDFRKKTKSWFLDKTHISFKKMRDAFTGFDHNLMIVSVSPWLMERALCSPILEEKNHCVILNGINTNIFRYQDKQELKEKYNVNYKKIIFHATAMFRDNKEDLKGGGYIIELAEKMQNEDIAFLIAGKHSVSRQLPENVILLGEIFEQEELAGYYAMADLTILTSQRETYSMVCAESLCCGTPVVGFKAGAPEQIALSQYSLFVNHGDTDALKSGIESWLEKKWNKKEIAAMAKEHYSQQRMVDQYMAVYKRMICER